ncbi:MAG: ABC transporter substrate-binding protein [Dehalococcoidia bacterium]
MVGAGLAGAALVGCSAEAPKPTATAGAPAPGQATGTAAAAGPARPGVPVVKGAVKEGGTWTEAVTTTSPQQDMHTALAQSLWHYISEPALMPDPWTGEITANVIEKWEVPDSTHFVFTVRKGVKIHNVAPWNGRDFDAEDLAFNINRIAGNTAAAEGLPVTAFQRSNTLAGMSKVEVVDKSTVKVTMAKPSSAYMRGFLEWRNVLMPKGIVEVGFKDPMKFASFGAYQMAEFVPNVRESFTKFAGYYRSGEPHFDKVVHNVVPDAAGALAGFISKQFSVFGSPTPQDEQTIKAARPDALLYSTPGSQWLYLWPSAKFDQLSDYRVRKAFQLAINYQEMGDGFYGPGWEYTGLLYSSYPEAVHADKIKTMPGFNPATKAQDIAEAQKLMSAAGHANGAGISFEILTPTGTGVFAAHNQDALRFQAQMQKAFTGIKVAMKPVADRAQFATIQASRNFQMMSYSSVPQPDVASEANSLFHSKGGRNYANFSEPEADALLEKALTELDSKARAEIFAQFQDKCDKQWQPILPLYVQPNRTMLQPNIGGFDKAVGPWSQAGGFHRPGQLYYVA